MGNAFVPNDTLMNSCGVPGTGFYVGFKTWILDEMGSISQKRRGLCYQRLGILGAEISALCLCLDDTGNLLKVLQFFFN